MTEDRVLLDEAAGALRRAGARFAYLFGSRATGRARDGSDIDVAAFFGREDVDASRVAAKLPGRVDLLVLDGAPLELAGRVAMEGKLLFEEDPAERVEWEATQRKIWLDERPRVERARREFIESARARGRR